MCKFDDTFKVRPRNVFLHTYGQNFLVQENFVFLLFYDVKSITALQHNRPIKCTTTSAFTSMMLRYFSGI